MKPRFTEVNTALESQASVYSPMEDWSEINRHHEEAGCSMLYTFWRGKEVECICCVTFAKLLSSGLCDMVI